MIICLFRIAGYIGRNKIWRLGPKSPLQKYWQTLIWQCGEGSPYVYSLYSVIQYNAFNELVQNWRATVVHYHRTHLQASTIRLNKVFSSWLPTNWHRVNEQSAWQMSDKFTCTCMFKPPRWGSLCWVFDLQCIVSYCRYNGIEVLVIHRVLSPSKCSKYTFKNSELRQRMGYGR